MENRKELQLRVEAGLHEMWMSNVRLRPRSNSALKIESSIDSSDDVLLAYLSKDIHTLLNQKDKMILELKAELYDLISK